MPYLVVAARCLFKAQLWPLCQLQWIQVSSLNFVTVTVVSLGSGSVFSASSSVLCFPVRQDSLRSGRDCESSSPRRHLQHRTYEFAPLVQILPYQGFVYAVLNSSVLLFFLRHFDPITVQGLPLGGFAITLIGDTTLGMTPLGEYQPDAETSTWQPTTLITDK